MPEMTVGAALTSPTFHVHSPVAHEQFEFFENDRLAAWDAEMASCAVEQIFFAQLLSNYFGAQPYQQQNMRCRVADKIRQSAMFRTRVQQVLEFIADRKTEENIAAAIDLLTIVGPRLAKLGTDLSFASEATDEDAAFALATSVGRVDSTLVTAALVRSPHGAVREAGIELLSDMSPSVARPVLTRLAQCDPEEHLRELAETTLRELDEAS